MVYFRQLTDFIYLDVTGANKLYTVNIILTSGEGQGENM